jgi:glycosidase
MTRKRYLPIALLLVCSFAWAQPSVRKVDPPNWWIGLSPEPMLLIYGDGLAGARVTTDYPGVEVRRTQASADGHYLFCWLRVSSAAHPGTLRLAINSGSGTAEAKLVLAARDHQEQGHAGLSRDDVVYLIMPDRFADGDGANDNVDGRDGDLDRAAPVAYHGGDLHGITNHLGYLHDLGVTAIWMTPVWQNAERVDYHGYHVADFYAVDPHFGSLADLQELVTKAHQSHLKIILDYVANHTSPRHAWVLDPPTATWFHGTPDHHLEPAYNFAGVTDPHAPAAESRAMLEGWFAGRLPDLNPDDPLLAQYLLQNAEWWMESTGADAFRLDTFPYSSRRFWSGWHEGLFRAFPRTSTIGEIWDADPTITSFFAGGRAPFDGIDTHLTTLFDFPLEFAIRDVVLQRAPATKLVDVLRRDWLYPHPESLVTFFANHDMKRFMSEGGASPAKLKCAFALVATVRGIPEIYYGDEIAMTGGDDPDNRHDFPGGFAGDSHQAFDGSGRTPQEQAVFAYVQSLLRLRREHPALRRGAHWHLGWGDRYYSYLRDDGADRVLVVFNSSSDSQQLTIPLAETPAAGFTKLGPLLDSPPATVEDNTLRVTLAGSTVAMYSLQ